jgi:hypothetical protein
MRALVRAIAKHSDWLWIPPPTTVNSKSRVPAVSVKIKGLSASPLW